MNPRPHGMLFGIFTGFDSTHDGLRPLIHQRQTILKTRGCTKDIVVKSNDSNGFTVLCKPVCEQTLRLGDGVRRRVFKLATLGQFDDLGPHTLRTGLIAGAK